MARMQPLGLLGRIEVAVEDSAFDDGGFDSVPGWGYNGRPFPPRRGFGCKPMEERKLLEMVAGELGLAVKSVEAAAGLLASGAPATFIARFRREVTGGLREGQVRAIAACLEEVRELERRRQRCLKEAERQGKLTEELRARVAACRDRRELDDLWLPLRQRRRTRGRLAAERGLEPLAREILAQSPDSPPLEEMAARYVDPERGVPDAASALTGAQDIIAEVVAESATVRGRVRELFAETSLVRARVRPERAGQRSKYEMYYDFSEPAASIPSHRILALHRGEKEGWLKVWVEADRQEALRLLRAALVRRHGSAAATVVETACADAYDRLLAPALEAELRAELKRRADQEAIRVFARNLRNLLLQPPAGPLRTLGVDASEAPRLRLAVVERDGSPLEHCELVLAEKGEEGEQCGQAARQLLDAHKVEAVAVGQSSGARKAERFFREVLRGMRRREVPCVVVTDAGSNVYATSRQARAEFPDLGPAARRAVSAARRLQDPLAELVKVDPKAIGVGEYQHDVNQRLLREGLEGVVESCVAAVGADVNTASVALLSRVPGLGRQEAEALVRHREEHGPFPNLAAVREALGMSKERFDFAAGFLRVRGGDEPLDATGIHPERYELVRRMAADLACEVRQLLGNRELVERIDFGRYAEGDVGEPTLGLLRRELLRPGHDPRGEFRWVRRDERVSRFEDLKEGMVLEGQVTNVTNFGAFVDIGLDEDGLVHVSHLARGYVRDPNEAVRVGEIVRVKVVSVDSERRRIGLSLRGVEQPGWRRRGKRRPKRARAEAKKDRKPKRSPFEKATPEDIARLIAHFGSR